MNSIISNTVFSIPTNSKIVASSIATSISRISLLKRNKCTSINLKSTIPQLNNSLLFNNKTNFSNEINSQYKYNLRQYSQKKENEKAEKAEKTEKNEKDEKKVEETKKVENENNKKNESEEKKEIDPAVKKLLEEKDKKISDLQDAYKRALADTENIRERTRKEIQKSTQFAIQKFAKDLLETSDVLKMALDSVPEKMREEKSNTILYSLYTGVSMTRVQMLNSFKKHGLEVFNPIGEKFDANKHQAMFQTVIPDKEPGIIISVQKEGYILNGRILRPAQVGIVKENEKKDEKKDEKKK